MRGNKQATVETEQWKLHPLLSRAGLWERQARNAVTNPYKHTTTQHIIDEMTKIMKNDMGVGDKYKGRKTLMIREAAFVIFALAGGMYASVVKVSYV